MEFRCDPDGIWHSCVDCVGWPGASFNVIRMEKLPPDFELCHNCKILRAPVRILVPQNAARRWTCMALPLLLLFLAFYVWDIRVLQQSLEWIDGRIVSGGAYNSKHGDYPDEVPEDFFKVW